MKNNTLFAAVFVTLSGLSNFAMAANPFLVSSATVEPNGGRAVQTDSKSVTLAESLVQLRHCHMNEASESMFDVESVEDYEQSAAEDFDFDLSEVQVIQ